MRDPAKFLSWGDYTIPFEWGLYWAKHFYIWSFQSGTANPDGVIRLPGRLLNFIVLGATNNVGLGYFYIFSSLIFAGIAFFLFARKFLKIERTSVQVIGALFFALNPIFLGNVAKIGLVLAAAMLPLCLLAIRSTFVHKRFRYLLIYILLLNISFLHPYTFLVNLAISGSYFLWMAWQNRTWAFDVWPKFVVIGLFAISVNLYFVLPLLSMGTVSKDVISTNITPSPVDYTALVGVSNTGDLFTGFSLSKNVFVDFAFYNSTYQNVYFFGVFLFYVILFWLYLHTEKRLKLDDKRRLGIFFGGFLAFLLLAATTVAHIDTIIKILIGLPGGWAFRSPLKWQLYIPLVLFGILVVLLNRVKGKWRLIGFEAALLLTFAIMNAYIATDLYAKILTPRAPQFFTGLAHKNLDGKTVLFINNGQCMDLMRTYPVITTELNQIFGSKNAQLKHVLEDSIDSVNLSSYDYVLSCQMRDDRLLTKFDFKRIGGFVQNAFGLYANQNPTPSVAAADQVYDLATRQLLADKYRFVREELGGDFSFLIGAKQPTPRLGDVFESISPKDIHDGFITAQIAGGQSLRLTGNEKIFYQLVDNQLALSPVARTGLQPVEDRTIDLPNHQTYTVNYQDAAIKPYNLVPNGSFEQGAWQGTVGDCYAYDDKPIIGMKLNSASKTAGKQSLELSARSHIACTGPEAIPVKSGDHYLLSFDYQSPDKGKYAGFYVSFDDTSELVLTERMQGEGSGWHGFSKEISVPEGATSMRLLLYAFPDSFGEKSRIARYDQVSLTPVPPAQNRFYLVNESSSQLKKPATISYKSSNPTRRIVQISGATKPFYLTTNESYDPLWQAEVVGARPKIQLPFGKRNAVATRDHLALNGTMNAWYIDPVKLCAASGCTQNADGSYNLTLALEFTPQRWFYFGAVISLTALAAGAAYFLYDRRNGEQHREGRWRWHK